MPTPPEYRQTTDIVRVTLKMPGGKKTFWAKPMKPRKPGTRVFLKVNDQGECPSSYNKKTDTSTETKEFFVCTDADVLKVEPAIMSLWYGELEVVD